MSIEHFYTKILDDVSSLEKEGVALRIIRQCILIIILIGFGWIMFNIEEFGVSGILLGILTIGVSSLMFYQLLEYLIFIHFLGAIKKYNPLIYSKESHLEKMILVLQKIYRIAGFFRYIKSPQMISSYHPNTLIQNEFQFLLLRISEMKLELERKIESQITTLESSKECIGGISGSSEIIHLFELQKTRLERQIEQFEELQKVLMHS